MKHQIAEGAKPSISFRNIYELDADPDTADPSINNGRGILFQTPKS
ncbi:MAG: hypothetical protein KUG79_02185 [Pseudomonadales bacterium]|nr:hypothetical protein [Pseudomonadales bacterium]